MPRTIPHPLKADSPSWSPLPPKSAHTESKAGSSLIIRCVPYSQLLVYRFWARQRSPSNALERFLSCKQSADRAPINTFHLLRQISLVTLLSFGVHLLSSGQSLRSFNLKRIPGAGQELLVPENSLDGDHGGELRPAREQWDPTLSPRYTTWFLSAGPKLWRFAKSPSEKQTSKQTNSAAIFSLAALGKQSNAQLVNCQETTSQSTKASHS